MKLTEDTSPARYMECRAIVMRCQDSLERLDVDDPLRLNVEALMELAAAEMEKAAQEMPF
jgi:hypothetical protein